MGDSKMIKFGTGGWRAVIGFDFICDNVRRVAAGILALAKEQNKTDKPVVIGYDRRFLSDSAAKWVAEVLAAGGVDVWFLHRSAPTPLVMHTVKNKELYFGIEITASHNPANYNGIKLIVEEGRDAPVETTSRLEKLIEDMKNQLIDYEVAVNDYGVMRYQTFKYNGRDVYFYNGDEIKESVYLKGKAAEDADLRALKEEEFKVIRVHDTNEFIDAVESIYTGKVNGRYKLIYSKYEYEDFSMYKIKRYYKNNILTDIDTNMYKFDEYGILFPTRFIPVIGEEETIINFNNVMISDLELNYVKEFSEYFKTLLKDKSDYEKVLGIYTYIKDTTEYVSDDGYEEMDNALLSPYDVLFDKKMVCIGAATTFQYLAEELGLNVSDTKRLEFHEVTYHAIKEALENDNDEFVDEEVDLDKVAEIMLKEIKSTPVGEDEDGSILDDYSIEGNEHEIVLDNLPIQDVDLNDELDLENLINFTDDLEDEEEF